MKKIDFKTKSLLDNKEVIGPIAVEEKYLLLSLFVGQYRFSDNVQEIIEILELVKSKEKTWEEILKPYGNNWDIGYGNGCLDLEGDTAYFVSNNNDDESFAMPLDELISLMRDWKAFLG